MVASFRMVVIYLFGYLFILKFIEQVFLIIRGFVDGYLAFI
jgi:hypothetical protein